MFDNSFDCIQRNVQELYEMHDAFLSDPAIFGSIPFPNFARFSMIVLPHLYTVLSAYKAQDPSFQSILEREIVMFPILKDVLSRNMDDDTITSVLDRIFDSLKGFECQERSEDSYRDIGKAVTKMYCLLITTFKKIHSSFSIIGDLETNALEAEDRKEAESILEIAKDYESQFKVQFQQMTNFFQSPKLTDLKTKSDDNFLMEIETIDEFKDFLKGKTTDFHKCIICLEKPAVLYAVPCNCPIICEHCHIPKEDLSSTCIRCGKPVKEYVRIE